MKSGQSVKLNTIGSKSSFIRKFHGADAVVDSFDGDRYIVSAYDAEGCQHGLLLPVTMLIKQ